MLACSLALLPAGKASGDLLRPAAEPLSIEKRLELEADPHVIRMDTHFGIGNDSWRGNWKRGRQPACPVRWTMATASSGCGCPRQAMLRR